ncbi:MAG: hypothetical protein WCG28_00970 [bacterium]
MEKDFDKWNKEKKDVDAKPNFKEVVAKLQNLLKIESSLTGAFSEAEATNK